MQNFKDIQIWFLVFQFLKNMNTEKSFNLSGTFYSLKIVILKLFALINTVLLFYRYCTKVVIIFAKFGIQFKNSALTGCVYMLFIFFLSRHTEEKTERMNCQT